MNAEDPSVNPLDSIFEIDERTGQVRGRIVERVNVVQNEQPVTLFDEKERNYNKPSLHAESTYSFYDRSSLTGFAHLRQMLQRWLNRLPPEKQKDIAARMRHNGRGSPREEQNFDSAFFELFMHEFLIGAGGAVVVEPNIEGLTPDFGVAELDSGGSLISYVVEATNVNVASGAEFDSNWNENHALDIFDEIVSPDFFLHVQTSGELTETPSRRALRKPFEQLVRNADYDHVYAISDPGGPWKGNLPSAEFRQGNWRITGHLLPVSRGRRPKKGRFIGAGPTKGGSFDPVDKLKTRLYEKAKRYKRIDRLIIALRSDWNIEMDDVAEALFGRRSVRIYVPKDPSADFGSVPPARNVQLRDGFWFNSRGPQNCNVAGVMVFRSLYPQNLDRATMAFFGNPYSMVPTPAWATVVTRAQYCNGEVQIVDGVPLSEFAKDHEPWQEAWKLERQLGAR